MSSKRSSEELIHQLTSWNQIMTAKAGAFISWTHLKTCRTKRRVPSHRFILMIPSSSMVLNLIFVFMCYCSVSTRFEFISLTMVLLGSPQTNIRVQKKVISRTCSRIWQTTPLIKWAKTTSKMTWTKTKIRADKSHSVTSDLWRIFTKL